MTNRRLICRHFGQPTGLRRAGTVMVLLLCTVAVPVPQIAHAAPPQQAAPNDAPVVSIADFLDTSYIPPAEDDKASTEEEILDLLLQLNDRDPAIRKQAVAEIAAHGDEARPALPWIAALLDDEDESVRGHAAMGVYRIDGVSPPVLECLTQLLESETPPTRRLAAHLFAQLGEDAAMALPELKRHAPLAEPPTRLLLIEAIRNIDPREPFATDLLVELLSAPEAEVRLLTVYMIAEVGDDPSGRFRSALADLVQDDSPEVRSAAESTIQMFDQVPETYGAANQPAKPSRDEPTAATPPTQTSVPEFVLKLDRPRTPANTTSIATDGIDHRAPLASNRIRKTSPPPPIFDTLPLKQKSTPPARTADTRSQPTSAAKGSPRSQTQLPPMKFAAQGNAGESSSSGPQSPATRTQAPSGDTGSTSPQGASELQPQESPAAKEPVQAESDEAQEPSTRNSSQAAERSAPATISYAALRALNTKGDLLSRRIRQESSAAFDMGLMPLDDYVANLATIKRLDASLAVLNNDRSTFNRAFENHAAAMQSAASRLAKLDQPGAVGWSADLLQARALAAAAEVDVATARNDADAYVTARQRTIDLSQRQFAQRLADYEHGLASVEKLADAAVQLDVSSVDVQLGMRGTEATLDSLQRYRNRLQADLGMEKTASREQRVSIREADRLLARFELARTSAQLDRFKGDEQSAAAQVATASNLAGQLFELQHSHYRTGTASLSDLARTWQRRQTLHDRKDKLDPELRNAVAGEQRENLSRMLRLSGQMRDRSGRYAAEASLVEGLDLIWRMDALKPRLAAGEAARR